MEHTMIQIKNCQQQNSDIIQFKECPSAIQDNSNPCPLEQNEQSDTMAKKQFHQNLNKNQTHLFDLSSNSYEISEDEKSHSQNMDKFDIQVEKKENIKIVDKDQNDFGQQKEQLELQNYSPFGKVQNQENNNSKDNIQSGIKFNSQKSINKYKTNQKCNKLKNELKSIKVMGQVVKKQNIFWLYVMIFLTVFSVIIFFFDKFNDGSNDTADDGDFTDGSKFDAHSPDNIPYYSLIIIFSDIFCIIDYSMWVICCFLANRYVNKMEYFKLQKQIKILLLTFIPQIISNVLLLYIYIRLQYITWLVITIILQVYLTCYKIKATYMPSNQLIQILKKILNMGFTKQELITILKEQQLNVNQSNHQEQENGQNINEPAIKINDIQIA